jgi:Protein of unknown function (DUF3239)
MGPVGAELPGFCDIIRLSPFSIRLSPSSIFLPPSFPDKLFLVDKQNKFKWNTYLTMLIPSSTERWNADEASNPACVPVSRWRWFICYPLWPIIWMSLVVISIGMCVWLTSPDSQADSVKMVLGLCVLSSLFANWFYWKKLESHFAIGDALPGIVIAMNPTRVAVLCNLTKGQGRYPAVKVVKIRLRKISGQPIVPGMGLAMVATYREGDSNKPYWNDITPLPLEAVNVNPQWTAPVVASFSTEDWNALADTVAKLHTHNPGLYRMHPPV